MHRARIQATGTYSTWMPGAVSVLNIESQLVQIDWNQDSKEWQQWKREPVTVCHQGDLESACCPAPSFQWHTPARGRLRPRGVQTEPLIGSRLSYQLYGNFYTDQGSLNDLRAAAWRGHTNVTAATLAEAEGLIKELYLWDVDEPRAEDWDEAWTEGLVHMVGTPTNMAQAQERPTQLATAALAGAELSGASVRLVPSPVGEGKGAQYPTRVRAECARRGVDLLSRKMPTGEAAVAAIHMAGGDVHQVPVGQGVRVEPATAQPQTGHVPIDICDMPLDQEAALEAVEAHLAKTWTGDNGTKYTTFQRLQCSCEDGCAEKSIYFGVCSGNKRQPPLSERVGQYNTHPHPQFDFEEQLLLKRQLMELINAHVILAEAHAAVLHPQQSAKQARLRCILSTHPVFQQTSGTKPWFKKLTSDEYIGCGLQSKLFTNGYISIGNRSRGLHSDRMNPTITFLSTKLSGTWSVPTAVSGQTVLFDRFATKALVVEDSHRGKVLVGGLNGFKHANFGPRGDVTKN